MSTALAAQTTDHPAVLAKLASANTPKRGLEIAERYAALSTTELKSREKRYDLLGMSTMFGSLIASPIVGLGLAVQGAGFGVTMGSTFGLTAILLGGMLLSAHRGLNYTNARRLREIRAKEDREAHLIADLNERFAIKLSSDEVLQLQYPLESPQSNRTIRYGTIDRMTQDPEGESARLEQITLVWSGGEFHLLRSTTFEGVKEGGLR